MSYDFYDENSKRYYLSYKFVGINNKVINRDMFFEKVLPYINLISRRFSTRVSLSFFHRLSAYAVFHTKLSSDEDEREFICGEKLTLYASAAGKLLLANLSDDDLNEYMKKVVLAPITAKTIIFTDYLRRQIMKIRESG